MKELSFLEKLTVYYKASQPYLLSETPEETRLQKEVTDYLKKDPEMSKLGIELFTWDEKDGVVKYNDDETVSTIGGTAKPAEFVDHFNTMCSDKKRRQTLTIVKGFHHYVNGTKVIRSLLNNFILSKKNKHILLFVSPKMDIPLELSTFISYLDFSLPTETAIAQRLAVVETSYTKAVEKIGLKIDPMSDAIKQSAIEAALGLTAFQAEDAFTVGSISAGAFDDKFVSYVFQEKIQTVRKSGLLTYLPPDTSFDDLGGLGDLKKWLKMQVKTFSKEAKVYGLTPSKGLLLNGISGTGKTAIAKAVSKEFNAPCFQLDVGGLFDSKVGGSEANMRSAIKVIEAIGRAVLLVDEIEKSLNKSATSGTGDSGTSSRLFATLLNWMSEHTSPVFIVGTSNDFTVLPPELLRKGRFSELFWLDLPDQAERQDIWRVIIRRHKRNVAEFNVMELAEASDKYTGAEIQEAFISAMTSAFSNNTEVTQTHVLAAIKDMKPQAEINPAQLQKMRDEAANKLRSAKGLELIGTPKEFRAMDA